MDGRRDERRWSGSRRAALKAGGAGVAALGLAGCLGRTDADVPSLDPDSPDDIERGGTFTVGITDTPEGTNPLAVTAEESFAITELLNGFGTAVDPVDFEVHPSVFTKWNERETEKPNAKPAVRFAVRSGLAFADGTACTVEDVLFTYRYLLDHRPEKYESVLEPIESVERASSSRWDLTMHLSEPAGTYDSVQLGVPVLPKHVWQDVETPEEYRPTDHGTPVGLGPARLTTYEPEEEIELAFREGYPLGDLDWIRQKDALLDGGPFLDGLRYRVYDDDAALEAAFRDGEVDSMYGSFAADEIESVLENDRRDTVRGSDDSYTAFGFDLRTTPLDDLPFRQVFGFAFDDRYWTEELNHGHAVVGDFVVPPGYTAVRPEHQPSVIPRGNRPAGQARLTGPSTEAFAFREAEPGSGRVDVSGVRSFLASGTLIDGTAGTFVGQEYPDSLTGAHATQTEPKYEYTFESVESDVLDDAATEKEVRADGDTITAINDGPLVLFTRPPEEKPKEATMTQRYVRALRRIGIPVERREIGTDELEKRVYRREEFDIAPLDAPAVSEFAVESLHERYHGDHADDHAVADVGRRYNTRLFLGNAMGYGLTDAATADDLIDEALDEMSVESRNDLIRRAVERIYLDFPVMVASYETLYWPADTRTFEGFVEDVPAPGDTYLPTQLLQLHRSSGA